MPIGLQALEETSFTWSNPRWVSFQFNQEPLWLPIYGTSPFPDSFHFSKSRTNPKHHRDWKTQTSSTKYWSWSRLFFLLFHPRNSKLKKKNSSLHRPLQLYEPANSSITPLGWMSVLISRQPPISQNRPPQNITYSTKTPNSKKIFRINIITIICKLSINSSVNGFRQIS